jgi:hypothetical protein
VQLLFENKNGMVFFCFGVFYARKTQEAILSKFKGMHPKYDNFKAIEQDLFACDPF